MFVGLRTGWQFLDLQSDDLCHDFGINDDINNGINGILIKSLKTEFSSKIIFCATPLDISNLSPRGDKIQWGDKMCFKKPFEVLSALGKV